MENKNQIFLYFFIIFMLLGLAIISFIYYFNQEDKCRVNPLMYGANYYLNNSNAKAVYGELVLMGEVGSTTLVIQFNDHNIKIEKRGENAPQ